MKGVNRINIIKKIQSNFENMSKISETILILGQLFILFLLLGVLSYMIFALYIEGNICTLPDLLLIGRLVRENAAAALAIIWGGSLFIDYIEKNGNK